MVRGIVEDCVLKYNEAYFGNGCFSLMSAEWTSRPPGSSSSVYFEVDDIDHLVESLQAKGVVIEGGFDGPVCKQASFCDPQGNKVNIDASITRLS